MSLKLALMLSVANAFMLPSAFAEGSPYRPAGVEILYYTVSNHTASSNSDLNEKNTGFGLRLYPTHDWWYLGYSKLKNSQRGQAKAFCVGADYEALSLGSVSFGGVAEYCKLLYEVPRLNVTLSGKYVIPSLYVQYSFGEEYSVRFNGLFVPEQGNRTYLYYISLKRSF